MILKRLGKSRAEIPKQDGSERREHKRYVADYVIVVRDGLSRIAAMGRAENISRGGLLLVCAHHEYVPRKGRLFVELHVPNEHGKGTRVERHSCRIAHVVQRDSGELALGVMFVDKGPR